MSRKKTALILAPLLVSVVGILILTVTPDPIDAAAYHPPVGPPLMGMLAPNERLDGTELLAMGQVNGPEDVAVDAAGRIIATDIEGRLMRIDAESRVETWVLRHLYFPNTSNAHGQFCPRSGTLQYPLSLTTDASFL